ncbi:MAG: ATP-binding protein [Nitrococcus mobilis]|nr:ATP-binding protein [Nitrococcus mobilis]
MKSIHAACAPRDEILAGTFNPEMFKASLSRVLEDYARGRASEGAESIYSDPIAFFRDATHATQGIKDILGNALGRLVQGDASRPAMQRLDTAFGGGKTHTLIALTHIALRGRELVAYTNDIVDPASLPEPGALRVVGIIGDTVDTIREQRDANGNPLPNTLWWLIAQQTLDASAQGAIEARLHQAAAPGSEAFFDTLFGTQPTVLIIDEVAQYLSRMEAAFPGRGAEQAAAFLMSLATYAEDKSHLSVVLSLASATNAFGDYNKLLRTLQQTHGLSESDADSIVRDAQHGFREVIERSAEATTPVQEGDLSKIMAKRLFKSVDGASAEDVADAFIAMYQRAGTELPAGARDPALRERLVDHYPFHPSLIEYLAEDLAQVETFQGTRGLLRTLARAVRRLWERRLQIPLIQTCHLDLSDSQIRNELLGKTGNSDLRAVLDSDVSKPSEAASPGRTVAGDLDAGNPHPDGYPVHEWAWRVVFLHSLIGRAGGLTDERFGIDVLSAIYECAAPAMPPVTARTALEQIAREANYLRERQGRLYADTAPTLNNIVRRIENNVTDEEALDRIEQVVRGLLRTDVFDVRANITASEGIPDKLSKPQLGVLSFRERAFEPVRFVERHGDAPRICQNLVFVLAPSTAHPKGETWLEPRVQQANRAHQHLLSLARKAIALERLEARPEAWGVSREQLQRNEFRDRLRKTPNELRTSVEENYRYLAYPGRDGGRIVIRDLGKAGDGPSAGGSSGLLLESNILSQLANDGELIGTDRASSREVLHELNRIFFASNPQVDADRLESNFARLRHWPILQTPRLLRDILREGAARGIWCLAHLPDRNAHKPDTLYHRDAPPPITVEPVGAAWIICTREHAKQLGWLESIVRDPNTIANWVRETSETLIEADIPTLVQTIENQHDKVDPNVFIEQVENLLKSGELAGWPTSAFDDTGRPDPARAYVRETVPPTGVRDGDVKVMPYHVAQERGWIAEPQVEERPFQFTNEGRIKQILNLLSGTALKGSETEVRQLQIAGQGVDGAQFQLAFLQTTVGALIDSRTLFAEVATRFRFNGPRAQLVIRLGRIRPECRFAAALEGMRD